MFRTDIRLHRARALDVLAGMLIYCQRDGDAPPTAITVGMHRRRLDTWALTLSGTPADIEHRLKDLANRIVQRADIRLQASAPRNHVLTETGLKDPLLRAVHLEAPSS